MGSFGHRHTHRQAYSRVRIMIIMIIIIITMKVAMGVDGEQDPEQSCQVGMGPRFDALARKMMMMMGMSVVI